MNRKGRVEKVTWNSNNNLQGKGKEGKKKLRGKTDFVSYLAHSRNSTKIKDLVEMRTQW